MNKALKLKTVTKINEKIPNWWKLGKIKQKQNESKNMKTT